MRLKLLIIASASLIFILAGFFFSLPLINSGRIVYGLRLADEKIGGLKFAQAQEVLKEKNNEFKNSKFIFYKDSKKISATPEELGIEVSVLKTLTLAKDIGRPTNYWLGLRQQFLIFWGGKKVNAAYQWDEDTFGKFWQVNESVFVSNPPQEATLQYNFENQDFEVVPGKKGQMIDKKNIRQELTNSILALKTKNIAVSLKTSQPFIFEKQQTETAKNKAKAILEIIPYNITSENFSQLINKYQLIDWLIFEPLRENDRWMLEIKLNQEKIRQYLIELSPNLYQGPVNAQITQNDGKITIFSLAKNGQNLNIEKSSQAIKENVLAKNKNIQLVFDKIPPAVKTDQNIVELGLTSFLGQGESNFAGSPNNRIHNIKIGSLKLSGVLIKPGEEFSFLDNLGEVGPEQNYLPELVIKKDKTIPEYGGGLCQVSTTMFRAAITSGLKVTERAPHAFPVKYYSPQGFDATIYPPHPDLKFVNDTPANILIQSKIIGTRLIFEIYGTKNERQALVKGPFVLESNPDGSMKTVLYQEIWRDDALERKDTFHSSYKSPALYPVERNPLE